MAAYNEQVGPRQGKGSNKWVKKQKARLERRKSKKQPECIPTYKKYNGYD